ncbi:sigma 54 modulation/S30EA ribosomal C-terminal domain-containing protein [Lentzea aerocolonigenes]|uniref:sigma 54 modulation/S30EA ribosomal C-terminal domain-containing protein n=1 Tax=Lentzea aerocolonigenes TaxID=68170 RepID=UPI0006917FC9|nr:sigma 54 modulation/S30EA ribosomal C-terminal domain-containing protein [Lentzea aerocolonigenes]MCP2246599.1 Sigma 54 modulation/S30EA ribosomal protein C terminus [Lentzea aerocolonigenes]
MRRRRSDGQIATQTAGEVLDDVRELVRDQVDALLARLPGASPAVRIKLTRGARSASPWSALVQANFELRGQPVRGQAAGAFFPEAAQSLRRSLAQRLPALAGLEVWRNERPRVAVVEVNGQREIVRRKYCTPVRCTPDQAARTMDLMDYDVHLFVDAETGEDSAIYRIGPTGYRLARLVSTAPPAGPVSVPLTVNVHEVPLLTPEEAVERLDATELPFRFFRSADTNRGSVLYRRYDGHYGLITPAAR